MRANCPNCEYTMFDFRVCAEPLTNPKILGQTGFVCLKCNLIFVSESVHEKMPFLRQAKLRKGTPKLKTSLAVYEDLLGLIEPFVQFTQHAYQQGVSDLCLHTLSSLFLYLVHAQTQIEQRAEAMRKHLGK